MDETRLARLREELEKARKKRDDWDAKVKDLERKYREYENTCIHNMVHEANLTPEQLAELIRAASSGALFTGFSGTPGNTPDDTEDDDIFENEFEKEEN